MSNVVPRHYRLGISAETARGSFALGREEVKG